MLIDFKLVNLLKGKNIYELSESPRIMPNMQSVIRDVSIFFSSLITVHIGNFKLYIYDLPQVFKRKHYVQTQGNP